MLYASRFILIPPRKALVFDLDDTLYLERDYAFSGFDHIEEVFSFSGFGVQARELFMQGVRGSIFDGVLARQGITPEQGLVSRMVNSFREHAPSITLLPDAAWAIAWANRSFSVGLITDGYLVSQEAKVEALGLRECMDAVVLSDTWGRAGWKPSARPYEEVERRLTVTGCDCVYVGDNPRKDFVTARLRGWASVRVRREDGEHCDVEVPEEYEADYSISNLYELPALLGCSDD
jgi:putative hydrolase of the HAD superfamily